MEKKRREVKKKVNKQQKRPNENDDEDEGKAKDQWNSYILGYIYEQISNIYKREVVIEIEIEICVENILKREGN